MNAISARFALSVDAIHNAINFPYFFFLVFCRSLLVGHLRRSIHLFLARLYRCISSLALDPIPKIRGNLHQMRWPFLRFDQAIHVHHYRLIQPIGRVHDCRALGLRVQKSFGPIADCCSLLSRAIHM